MPPLEESLNTRLFDRVGKQVLLTQAGRVLLPQANRIIALFADTERQVRNCPGRSAVPCTWPPPTTSACTGWSRYWKRSSHAMAM